MVLTIRHKAEDASVYSDYGHQRLDEMTYVPSTIESAWEKWRNELPMLSQRLIPRCYFQNDVNASTTQLHGFVMLLRTFMQAKFTCIYELPARTTLVTCR